MADHNPQQGRRPHFHRGRRNNDRRGNERRSPQREHAAEPAARDAVRDGGVDVEQIMREIRSRIAQRHGIELSTQQIQELAARRLEAILEPRNIKPQLLEQLRRSAGSAPEPPSSPAIETYEFEDTTLYETHRGILRFFRALLNPILKLLFNPTPLINALHTQARINKELAARELERERRQSEWNALQYELMQRVVLEMSRLSIEMQALSAKIESLDAKVDFNERRVRGLENVPSGSQPRQQPRLHESVPPAVAAPTDPSSTEAPAAAEGAGDGTRRRRRRRRGRRSGGGSSEAPASGGVNTATDDETDGAEGLEGEDEEVTTPEGEDTDSQAVTGAAPALDQEMAAQKSDTLAGTASSAATPEPQEQVQTPAPVLPSPPRDEPAPATPVDHADPGPVDR